MYIPSADEILTSAPRPGTFYQGRAGIYPVKVAKVAYVKNGSGAVNIYQGLRLMNESPWNDHMRRSTAGYTSYPAIGKGIQFEPKYAGTSKPEAGFGSGHQYPVVWIPTEDGKEPDEVFESDPLPKFGMGPGPIDSGIPESGETRAPGMGGSKRIGLPGAGDDTRAGAPGSGGTIGVPPSGGTSGGGGGDLTVGGGVAKAGVGRWWMWALAGAVLLGGYALWRRRKKKRGKRR